MAAVMSFPPEERPALPRQRLRIGGGMSGQEGGATTASPHPPRYEPQDQTGSDVRVLIVSSASWTSPGSLPVSAEVTSCERGAHSRCLSAILLTLSSRSAALRRGRPASRGQPSTRLFMGVAGSEGSASSARSRRQPRSSQSNRKSFSRGRSFLRDAREFPGTEGTATPVT